MIAAIRISFVSGRGGVISVSGIQVTVSVMRVAEVAVCDLRTGKIFLAHYHSTVGGETDGPMREFGRSVSGRGDKPGGGGKIVGRGGRIGCGAAGTVLTGFGKANVGNTTLSSCTILSIGITTLFSVPISNAGGESIGVALCRLARSCSS